MLLVIDAGNTNTVFALYEGEERRAVWRLRTEKGRTADEYTASLYPLFQAAGFDFSAVDDVLISSVVPDENFNLRALADKTFGCQPNVIGSDVTDLGIKVDVPKPEEVGSDRLMNAIAVVQYHKAPAVVVDFGTSTNFDIVNADGAFCGGILAPGVNLSVKALHEAAAKLPKVSIVKPKQAIGTDTVSAMQSGLYWGYISMIEGLIDKIAEELGAKPLVIATGGLAGLFADGSDKIDIVDEELTLKGLLHVYKTKVKS